MLAKEQRLRCDGCEEGCAREGRLGEIMGKWEDAQMNE